MGVATTSKKKCFSCPIQPHTGQASSPSRKGGIRFGASGPFLPGARSSLGGKASRPRAINSGCGSI
jgi:hypothetical protein